jgi:hypothetical protein
MTKLGTEVAYLEWNACRYFQLSQRKFFLWLFLIQQQQPRLVFRLQHYLSTSFSSETLPDTVDTEDPSTVTTSVESVVVVVAVVVVAVVVVAVVQSAFSDM